MRPFSAFLLLVLAAFLWSWGHVCHTWSWAHHEMCYKDGVSADGTLGVKGTDLKGYEQFVFADSSGTPELSENNNKFLDDLAEYMKANPDHKLVLTGRFMPGEEPTGFLDNLGLERAAAVRVLLVSRGIDEDRIDLESQLVQRDDFLEPVSFRVDKPVTAAKTPKKGKFKKNKFTFTNMTYSDANFDSGSAIFNPGRGFRNYADSVKIFMAENPKKKLVIIGHTDSDGDDASNMTLGTRRAQAVRTYFQNLGVKSPISTETKGEREPVEPNDTPENKRKNRRVNVQIRG